MFENTGLLATKHKSFKLYRQINITTHVLKDPESDNDAKSIEINKNMFLKIYLSLT